MSDTLDDYGTVEHIRDELSWLEAGVRMLLDVRGDNPLVDPLAAYKGMLIKREELEAEDPSELERVALARQAYSAFRQETEEKINEHARRFDELPLLRLARTFQLTVWEYRCILLCLAIEVDRKFEKWYAFLNDDATARFATVELALHLLGEYEEDWQLGRRMLERDGKLRRWMLQAVDEGVPVQSLRSPLRLDERIVSFLLDMERIDGRLVQYIEASVPAERVEISWAGLSEVEASAQRVISEWPQDSLPIIGLWGARGSGKRAMLHRLAARNGQRLLTVSLASLPSDEERLRSLLSHIVREAILTESVLAFSEEDSAWQERLPRAILVSALAAYGKQAQKPIVGWLSLERRGVGEIPLPDQAAYWSVELPLPVTSVRAKLWQQHATELVNENISEASDQPDYAALAIELSDRFHLTPGQISSAWRQARVYATGRGDRWPRRDDLANAARGQFRHRLAQHAVAIEARRSWSDLILPAESKSLLQEACNRNTLRETVFDEWGFSSKLSYGTGTHMLFAGPPGTGKTMAAEVAARELGLELYRVDLSRIVSKYIGETEQRLRELFEEARQSSAILFFDEGDALFGKRTEVKDAHDRYANMEAAYLLQLIESYDGVTILATNLMQNLDEALLRRMSAIVKFPSPNADDRARIFESLLPSDTPLDEDLDIAFLAQRVDVSGGHIKNIVLASAFLAAGEQQPIGMSHMVRAARVELQKLGQIPMRSTFAPYCD